MRFRWKEAGNPVLDGAAYSSRPLVLCGFAFLRLVF